MGQRPRPTARSRSELAAKLHAVYPAGGPHWWCGPRAELDRPGIGGPAQKLRSWPNVELPHDGRLGAQHVTLKTDAVQVSDGGLGLKVEVGVGFVVGSISLRYGHRRGDQLERSLRWNLVRRGSPTSAAELVLGLAARHLQMRAHQLEAVGLAGLARAGLRATGWLGALGVPQTGS